jgi:hypothetical protein
MGTTIATAESSASTKKNQIQRREGERFMGRLVNGSFTPA